MSLRQRLNAARLTERHARALLRLPEEKRSSALDVIIAEQMTLTDVPEGEYIVFEHGPFDFATENSLVEERMERAMAEFDYESSPYQLDTTPGRFFYFYHDEQRYWKYIRPVIQK